MVLSLIKLFVHCYFLRVFHLIINLQWLFIWQAKWALLISHALSRIAHRFWLISIMLLGSNLLHIIIRSLLKHRLLINILHLWFVLKLRLFWDNWSFYCFLIHGLGRNPERLLLIRQIQPAWRILLLCLTWIKWLAMGWWHDISTKLNPWVTFLKAKILIYVLLLGQKWPLVEWAVNMDIWYRLIWLKLEGKGFQNMFLTCYHLLKLIKF